MQDLSLHILDIAENSIAAGSTLIKIMVNENIKNNKLTIKVLDNGRGINRRNLARISDPFYTTKKGKRIGLGLSLLAQSVQEANGKLTIKSIKGKGTEVSATFVYDHIDRKSLGNMGDTIMALVGAHGDFINFVYTHKKNGRGFTVATHVIRKALNGVSVKNPHVLQYLRRKISRELSRII